MKLMFFPVTIIEDLPHLLLNYNFSRRRDRYFLSPYDVDVSTHGSQKTVCQVIRSSDFLCGLLNIDRPAILKESSVNKHAHVNSTGSATAEETPSPLEDETSGRRALSCSVTVGGNTTSSEDLLLNMIEQKLDFKHRCVFYSTGPISDVCGELNKKIFVFLLNQSTYFQFVPSKLIIIHRSCAMPLVIRLVHLLLNLL